MGPLKASLQLCSGVIAMQGYDFNNINKDRALGKPGPSEPPRDRCGETAEPDVLPEQLRGPGLRKIGPCWDGGGPQGQPGPGGQSPSSERALRASPGRAASPRARRGPSKPTRAGQPVPELGGGPQGQPGPGGQSPGPELRGGPQSQPGPGGQSPSSEGALKANPDRAASP
ncbi:proline-rich proteoglycan 2-like [Antechinus flavipes]|uniref:proline-rich proteoglycan 2-like n=1 Tax=Antechinus flavipes TaxID=38775 RepID=UPI00223570FC|nr:proline-rich proteoglycan 2-like [Antechinus flavipes]